MRLSKYYLLGLLSLVLTTAEASGPFSYAGAQSNYQVFLPLVIDEPPAIQPTFTTYRLPKPENAPHPVSPGYMQWGPDGQLWFASDVSFYRFAPPDKLTRYEVGWRRGIRDFVVGPDGNFWWPRGKLAPGRVVEKFTPTGTRSVVLNLGGEVGIEDITVDPNGLLWFPLNRSGQPDAIASLTTSGEFTEFPITVELGFDTDITTGPDGNLWVTNNNRRFDGTVVPDSIVRITPEGSTTEFFIPTLKSDPGKIIAGPDGNLWFLECAANQVGRITPGGVITEFRVPTPESGLFDIIAGPDGNVWFTETAGNKIGRITPSGRIVEFEVPATGCEADDVCGGPTGLVLGPDRHLWFGSALVGSEGGVGRIGRVDGAFPTEK